MKYLLISIPKAGMHLFNQLTTREYTNIPYGSMVYDVNPHKTTIAQLKEFSGMGRTHISYHPIYEQILRNSEILSVFLYRDPRDLMVSYYFWTKKLGHSGHSIPGLVKDVSVFMDSDDPFTSMMEFWGEHIRRYLPWMFVSDLVLPISFEDLRFDTVETLKKVNKFFGGEPFGSPEAMSARMNPPTSPTFRLGIVGDWVNHFEEHHIEAFNKTLGDVMEFWGYV